MSSTSPPQAPHDPNALLRIESLNVFYQQHDSFWRRKTQQVHALRQIQLSVKKGEIWGIVGESGCGKSTLARTIVQLRRAESGRILFQGQDLNSLWHKRFGQWVWQPELFAIRRDLQMIFQDPFASLNPRMRAESLVQEPLKIHRIATGAELERQTAALFEAVGLSWHMRTRYPAAFSGGQRQRLGIARALALRPKLIIADEPLSALDVSIQAQIINLLQDLQAQFQLTMLLIAHDLAAVHHLCSHVAVMRAGEIVESGPVQQVFASPQHAYTRLLLAASPQLAPMPRDTK